MTPDALREVSERESHEHIKGWYPLESDSFKSWMRLAFQVGRILSEYDSLHEEYRLLKEAHDAT
jgi:hypothetical protein